MAAPGPRRRPPAGGGHRHPAPAQVALPGPDAVPPRVADPQVHVGVLGPPGPSRHHHQDRPAFPGPGHQPAGHGRPGREGGAEHHQVDAVDQRRGDLGPGGPGPGDHGQPGQVDAEVVGGDRTQAGEPDQRAPRARPRRRGQQGQGQADTPPASPSGRCRRRSWPVTTMVVPRRRPPSGNRPARGGPPGGDGSGSTRRAGCARPAGPGTPGPGAGPVPARDGRSDR